MVANARRVRESIRGSRSEQSKRARGTAADHGPPLDHPRLRKRGKAPATQKLYRFDFEIFVAWCEGLGLPALPAAPDTVALYLAHRANAGSRPLSIVTRNGGGLRSLMATGDAAIEEERRR